MTGARRIGGASLLAALALSAGGVARWRTAIASGAHGTLTIPVLSASPRIGGAAIDSGAAMVVENDPFRFSNTPPTVRFDPSSDASAQQPAMPLALPRLVLRAIVGGPPWSAVIDGLPGQPPGAVARQGSRFDELTVALIARDSVVVRANDTTWTLRFGGRS